jgi:hypothetical protein
LPVTTVFAPDQPFLTKVDIKNVGKTPARNITYGWFIEGIPKSDKANLEKEPTRLNLGILPAEGISIQDLNPFPAGESMGQDRFNAIVNGDTVVYYFGRVTYEDIFGASHWIKFCYIFNARRKIFDICSVHNSIDE